MAYNVWPDDAGLLRIGTLSPTSANDTSGSVVGDQASARAVKDILGLADPEKALEAILSTPVWRFRYKSGADNSEVFVGPAVEEGARPWFGKGFGKNQIPALNEINVAGHSILAIQTLHRRIGRLSAIVGVRSCSERFCARSRLELDDGSLAGDERFE